MIITFEADNFIVELAPEQPYEMQQQDSGPIDVEFSSEDFMCAFDQASGFVCDFTGGSVNKYSGPYEVTPSQQTQTLPTANKTLSQNVTVNPIPSNYGKITWDGRILTVS